MWKYLRCTWLDVDWPNPYRKDLQKSVVTEGLVILPAFHGTRHFIALASRPRLAFIRNCATNRLTLSQSIESYIKTGDPTVHELIDQPASSSSELPVVPRGLYRWTMLIAAGDSCCDVETTSLGLRARSDTVHRGGSAGFYLPLSLMCHGRMELGRRNTLPCVASNNNDNWNNISL